MKITLDITPEQAKDFACALENTAKGLALSALVCDNHENYFMARVYRDREAAVAAVMATVDKAAADWQRIHDDGKRELPDYPTASADDLEELDCMFGAIEARAQDARRHIASYGEGDESRLKAAAGCLHIMKWHLVEVGMWFYGGQCANISERKGGADE